MRENHRVLSFLDKIIDYLLNYFAAYASYAIVKAERGVREPLQTSQMLFVMGVLCLAISFGYAHRNVYAGMRGRKLRFFAWQILLSNFWVLLFALISGSLLNDTYTRFWYTWLWLFFLIGSGIMIWKRTVMLLLLQSIRSGSRNLQSILLVTDSRDMAEEYMEEVLDNPHLGYAVIGYVGNLSIAGLRHLGTTAEMDDVLQRYRPDEVVMAFETVRRGTVTHLIDACNDHCIKVLFVPAVCGYFKSPKQIVTLGNLPIVDVRSTPLDNPANRFVKRVVDVIGSSLLLALTSPLMLLTAIGVRVTSPGPILFRQTRVGLSNREFTMYKFRSMRVNADEQTGWTTDRDPRKTRFGTFIRKLALDELPQFFNVLKGDMSLVGPRPEIPFYVEKFKREIPLYMLKHSVRPGITGLAQIKGLRGDTSIRARIDADISYIENWSFWEDVRILFLTPFCTLNRHERYAAREARDEKRRAERARMTEDLKRKEKGDKHD